jgi:hypothetical protein
MATITIATITNHLLADEDYIAAALAAGDSLVVSVQNEFLNATPVSLPVANLTAAYKTALYNTIDAATFQNIPAGTVVIKAAFNGTLYTLPDSYVRAGIGSSGDPIQAIHETVLVFMVAWLGAASGVLELILNVQIAVDVDTTQAAALAARGINVKGTGGSITVTATVPYRVQTVVPQLPDFDYVIVHQYDINTIF